jgi:hypothetical protein
MTIKTMTVKVYGRNWKKLYFVDMEWRRMLGDDLIGYLFFVFAFGGLVLAVVGLFHILGIL